MQTFKEWREENQQCEDKELLLKNIDKLTQLAEQELRSYVGERFDGIIELTGALTELKRTLAGIQTGAADSPRWLSKGEAR